MASKEKEADEILRQGNLSLHHAEAQLHQEHGPPTRAGPYWAYDKDGTLIEKYHRVGPFGELG